MLHIVDAKYISDYKISVEFSDGCRCVADFERVVKDDHRPIVRQLSSPDLFRDFKVQAHTIVWSNSVDFAPEFIKELTPATLFRV